MIPEVERTLQAAQGYYELGMLEDAWEELDSIPEGCRNEAEVLHVRVMLLLKEERWDGALRTSLELCGLKPADSAGFIHAAFCLHELGRTAEARQTLLDGPASLQAEPTYFYNLACYAARLGEIPDAEQLLARACALDPKLGELARRDPDLEALRG